MSQKLFQKCCFALTDYYDYRDTIATDDTAVRRDSSKTTKVGPFYSKERPVRSSEPEVAAHAHPPQKPDRARRPLMGRALNGPDGTQGAYKLATTSTPYRPYAQFVGKLAADAHGLAHAAEGIADAADHITAHGPPKCVGSPHQPTATAVAAIHTQVREAAAHYGDRLKGSSSKLHAASAAYTAADHSGAVGITAVEL